MKTMLDPSIVATSTHRPTSPVAGMASGQGHLLPLAARQLVALIEPAAQRGVVALWQPLYHPVRATPGRRLLHQRQVLHLLQPAHPYIISRGEVVGNIVLEDNADGGAQ